MDNPVYESVKWLRNKSEHVGIDDDRLCEAAAEMASLDFDYPEWRFSCLPEKDEPGTFEFFFVINCLNFKFWHTDTRERFRATVDGEVYYGAFAMFALLNRWYRQEPALLTGEFMRELNVGTAEPRLTGDTGPIPELRERVRVLNETGEVLTGQYGDFKGLVEASSYRCFDGGHGIVERLVRDFPSFRDRCELDGRELIFNKRAQLAPAMAYARFRGTEVALIKDVRKLTAFADYQVPKGLLSYGILSYSDELAGKIGRKEILAKGGREELEIRANTICAVEALLVELNRIRPEDHKINAVQMDYHLWRKARDDPRQYHLTETTAY